MSNYYTKEETDQLYIRQGVDTPAKKSGVVAIAAGALSVAVVFPSAFSAIPSSVIPELRKPNGGDNIFATVRRDSITTVGFTVDLSGPPSGGGHELGWLALR